MFVGLPVRATDKGDVVTDMRGANPEEGCLSVDDLTVVIPCFNEAGGIGNVIDGLLEAVPGAEVIVVNDGSTDDSGDILRQYGSRIRVLEHSRNRGYGASIKTACAQATRPFVVWFDADGQHTPAMLKDVLQELRSVDCAIGARTSQSHSNWLRRPGKWVLYAVARLLTGAKIRDLNSGLRGFRTSVLKRYLHLLPNGFSASTTTTLLMFERGYRVAWVPITTRARVGKSTVKQARDGSRVIMLILHLVNMFRPLRFYMPVSLGFFLTGLGYGVTRALIRGQGIPTLAAVLMFLGVQSFFFGLLADQLSAMRKERYERPLDEQEPFLRSGTSAPTDGQAPDRVADRQLDKAG